MASVFEDRAGYRHTAHTVVRDQVVAHQVWTSGGADGWYIGVRQLLHYPLGNPWVPEGMWVFVSDFAPASARVVTPAKAERLLRAWSAAGAGFREVQALARAVGAAA